LESLNRSPPPNLLRPDVQRPESSRPASPEASRVSTPNASECSCKKLAIGNASNAVETLLAALGNSQKKAELSPRAAHLVQKEQEMQAAESLALHGGTEDLVLAELLAPVVLQSEPCATPQPYLNGHAARRPALDLTALEAKLGPSSPSCQAGKGRRQPFCDRPSRRRSPVSFLRPVRAEDKDRAGSAYSAASRATKHLEPCDAPRSRRASKEAYGRFPGEPPPLMQLAAGKRASRVQSLPGLMHPAVPQNLPPLPLQPQLPVAKVDAPIISAGSYGSSRSRRSSRSNSLEGIYPIRC